MKILYLFFAATTFLWASCQSNNYDKIGYDSDEKISYDKDKKFIKINHEYDYDIIPYADFNTSKLSAAIAMKLFNYGGDLRINQGALDNIFSKQLAQRSHYYVITPDEIIINNIYDDENYGKWAQGEVMIPDFNRYFDNVFISPLAYHHLVRKKDDGCLVLVRLLDPAYNATFAGVFYGDNTTNAIINFSYKDILTENSFSIKLIASEFWSPLFNDEEHQKYKAFCGALQMGLISNADEIPECIANKLNR